VLIIVLLVLSGLYSMSETAMMALSRGGARRLADQGTPGGAEIERMAREPNRILGTVLVGNNLTNIAASAVATALLVTALGTMGVTVATVVMTVVVLLVAEITPKTYAAHHPDRVALRLHRFLSVSAVVFTPVVTVLSWIGLGMIRGLGGRADGQRLLTEDEIRSLVDVGQEEGLLEQEEREMIQGIFELSDTAVHEVMVPRMDMHTLEADATLASAWETVIQAGHSRIPVWRESIDNIIGVLYARDILAYARERPLDTPVASLLRPAYYVPESKKVDELLADFRRERTHIAVVLDEFGGTAGLVTIEDLLEEIVGEIHDEYDKEEPSLHRLSDDEMEADGRVALDDLPPEFHVPVGDADVDTLGGFILHLLGRAPVQGETVEAGGLLLTAAQVTGRRVKRVRIRTLTSAGEADPRGSGASGAVR
jgi:putative hemolysin